MLVEHVCGTSVHHHTYEVATFLPNEEQPSITLALQMGSKDSKRAHPTIKLKTCFPRSAEERIEIWLWQITRRDNPLNVLRAHLDKILKVPEVDNPFRRE